MSYAKLYTDLLHSSILEENVTVRWLWVVLLISCNRFGQVSSTVPSLARAANLGLPETEAAMKVLMEPDPSSTTPTEDGRRIIPIGPNLWQVVNYLKYRNMRDPEVERERTRERVQRYRERKRVGNASGNAVTESVTAGNPIAEAAKTKRADTPPLTPPQGGTHADGEQDCPLSDLTAVVEEWNRAAAIAGLPKATRMTTTRKQTIRARLRELGMDGLRDLFSRVTSSGILTGGGDRGWRADLDWVLKPEHLTHILEGRYDGAGKKRLRATGDTPDHAKQVADLEIPTFDNTDSDA